MEEYHHIPVLLPEVMEGLHVVEGGAYIDGTLGGGGHTQEIIRRGGKVLGIDQDEDAVEYVRSRVESKKLEKSLRVVLGNFSDIRHIAEENEFTRVNGILLDLGFSSYQIDKSKRGFSFLRDETLDMRMSKQEELTAEEIVNRWPFETLVEIFIKYGEEHFAKKIAHHIVQKRKEKRITSSLELAKLIEEVVPRSGKTHPATRIFQALRIAVNDELNRLRSALKDGIELLVPGGRLAVISFHSLEDRIVKNTFRELELKQKAKIITKKAIEASESEISQNPRSRSAKLRIIEKL